MSTYDFSTLDNIETNGKRVFLRVDINVPLDPSTHLILDDTRIRAVSETLARLEDARVVLGSHQSRPGKDDFTSLEPHAQALAQYCNQEIKFVDDVIGPQARQRIGKVEPGQVLVLDNLRFCAEENIDDRPEKLLKTHFVKQLTPLFDLNVNDAFATAHRSQPSIVGLAEALPSVAGRLMENGAASSVTVASLTASRSTMPRRVASASALKRRSAPALVKGTKPTSSRTSRSSRSSRDVTPPWRSSRAHGVCP